jgi:hypothetical protein
MNLVEIPLIAAAFGYVMWRRSAGEPLQARRLVILPAALLVWGGYQVSRHHVTTLDVGLLVVEAAVALGLGLLRGLTIRVYEYAGHLWYRYRPLTLAVWVASALIRLGLGVGGHLLGASLATTVSLVFMLGVTFLGEAAVVGARALRTGVPFAPDRRSTPLAGARTRAGRGPR